MPEGLLKPRAEIGCPAGERSGVSASLTFLAPGSQDPRDPPASRPAPRRVGNDNYTRKESTTTRGPRLASLRTRRFGPSFQQHPPHPLPIANHSLAICGLRWSCAPGCSSPQMQALWQLRHPASCPDARQAGTSRWRLPLPAPLPAAENGCDFTHTLRAHTRAHNALSRRRCWHTRTSLDISLLHSLCGTCFPAPGSLFALLHLFFVTFLLSFPPSPNLGLPHSPPTAPWGPSPSPRDGEGAAETRPARAERGPCCARGRHRWAGLWPAPCLFSLRPLNARLRRKDYRGRIMPGVNTRANKSACTTPPTPLGPGPRGWGRERVPRC